MNLTSNFEETAQWIAKMAMTKGWLDYARWRCKELEKDEFGLHAGLGKRVKEIIDSLNKEST
jgi:hypothetical protein